VTGDGWGDPSGALPDRAATGPSTPMPSDPASAWPPPAPFAPPPPLAPTQERPPSYGHQPPQPAKADGFAIAALVLGILGGSLLALIFGVVSLSRIKSAGGLKTGRGMAIAGIVLGVVWLIGGGILTAVLLSNLAGRDSTATAADDGRVPWGDIRGGDCLADIPDEGTVDLVEVAPCTQPHHGEAFATFDLPVGPYPGDESTKAQAEDGCRARVPADVDVDQSLADQLGLFYLYPRRVNWTLGERSVLCIASSDEVLTRSIAP